MAGFALIRFYSTLSRRWSPSVVNVSERVVCLLASFDVFTNAFDIRVWTGRLRRE